MHKPGQYDPPRTRTMDPGWPHCTQMPVGFPCLSAWLESRLSMSLGKRHSGGGFDRHRPYQISNVLTGFPPRNSRKY
jgi:hypothetical protein